MSSASGAYFASATASLEVNWSIMHAVSALALHLALLHNLCSRWYCQWRSRLSTGNRDSSASASATLLACASELTGASYQLSEGDCGRSLRNIRRNRSVGLYCDDGLLEDKANSDGKDDLKADELSARSLRRDGEKESGANANEGGTEEKDVPVSASSGDDCTADTGWVGSTEGRQRVNRPSIDG